ncbi:hypothetical protein OQA88_214 [Cercophora sp. LCS_1]
MPATTPPVDAAIAAIRDARPPVTDPFAYLVILEANLSVGVLPTLKEILQDGDLTKQIGWDLVFALVNLPGSQDCLETIARLGNPREVILKVLESLQLLWEASQPDDDETLNEEKSTSEVPWEQKFVTLLGMLQILHKRLRTKHPSRFIAQTLKTVLDTYSPGPEQTAAIINLVHSLSGARRPALPSRKSSINVANPDQEGDASKNAPDPEADVNNGGSSDPNELALQQRLLLSFATCVLETYTENHTMAWATRLSEFYYPEKMVTRKVPITRRYKEEQALLEADAAVGQLVALIKDLGLDSCSQDFWNELFKDPVPKSPLSDAEDASSASDIPLSTLGCLAVFAYWVFSSITFDAYQPTPDIFIFPHHFKLMEKLVGGDDPQEQICNKMAAVDHLVTIGLWLHAIGRITPVPSDPLTRSNQDNPDDPTSDYMRYTHLMTLIAIYHPQHLVRNCASQLAGAILHADPSDEDRLRILYDLLENCTFPALKACAVSWLKDEIIKPDPSPSVFTSDKAIEQLQYVVFPQLTYLQQEDWTNILQHLAEEMPFILQVINFGVFLWTVPEKWEHVTPENLDSIVRERWFAPLDETVKVLLRGIGQGIDDPEEREAMDQLMVNLELLKTSLARLNDAKGFVRKPTAADLENRA